MRSISLSPFNIKNGILYIPLISAFRQSFIAFRQKVIACATPGFIACNVAPKLLQLRQRPHTPEKFIFTVIVYFTPFRRKFSDQHNQWDIRVAHDG